MTQTEADLLVLATVVASLVPLVAWAMVSKRRQDRAARQRQD